MSESGEIFVEFRDISNNKSSAIVEDVHLGMERSVSNVPYPNTNANGNCCDGVCGELTRVMPDVGLDGDGDGSSDASLKAISGITTKCSKINNDANCETPQQCGMMVMHRIHENEQRQTLQNQSRGKRDDADACVRGDGSGESEDDTEEGIEEMPDETNPHEEDECDAADADSHGDGDKPQCKCVDSDNNVNVILNCNDTVTSDSKNASVIPDLFSTDSDDVEGDSTLCATTSVATVTTTIGSYSEGVNNSCEMSSNPKKELKSLLKRKTNDSLRSKKRVTFSETMMVFCEDWPENVMPQIIALKSPTEFNLIEVQGYMYEPPIEYQDYLPFDPPPDYRDFITGAINIYDDDLTINYIDDDIDDSDENVNDKRTAKRTILNLVNIDPNTSKWENMILNDNEAIEEEQIIGVLKEDAILQAIGSHMLPEDQLCEDDFPIHFQNNENLILERVKLADGELSDITSDDGVDDSSPNGSLQDIASDSSITSQDTIILMTNDCGSSFMVSAPLIIDTASTVSFGSHGQPLIHNANNDNNYNNYDNVNHRASVGNENVLNVMNDSSSSSTEVPIESPNESIRKVMENELSDSFRDTTDEEKRESSVLIDDTNNERDKEDESVGKEFSKVPDVCAYDRLKQDQQTHDNEKIQKIQSTKEQQCQEMRENEFENNNETNLGETQSTQSFVSEVQIKMHHMSDFRKNLMFYESMGKHYNRDTSDATIRMRQQQEQQMINQLMSFQNAKVPKPSNVNNDCRTDEANHIEKQMKIHPKGNSVNGDKNVRTSIDPQCKQLSADPKSQHQSETHHQLLNDPTKPNEINWSMNDEFIIEYTSEPRALVPSKRTVSLSSFPNVPLSANPYTFKSNNNNNAINYLSLNRNRVPQQMKLLNQQYAQQQQELIPSQYQHSQLTNQRNTELHIPPQYSHHSSTLRPQQQHHIQQFPGHQQTQNVHFQSPVQFQRFPHHHSASYAPSNQTQLNPHSHPQHPQIPQMPNSPHHSHRSPSPHPPPYHYHVHTPQKHTNDFPNPSEIRRRDGLNAYPHVWQHPPEPGSLPVPPVPHQSTSPQPQTKDELEQFVQQDMQRTERIKKRYSFTEDDDPTFGFARRPSVRGIRPRYGSTTEILKQMQSQISLPLIASSQMAGNHVSWPVMNQQQQPQLVQIRVSQQQQPMPVKRVVSQPLQQQYHVNYPQQGQQKQAVRRPVSLMGQPNVRAIRGNDGLLYMFSNNNPEQMKIQISHNDQQLPQKVQSQQHPLKVNSMSTISVKPVLSSKDERGAPEGASSSPKHSSDLLFTKTNATTVTTTASTSGDVTTTVAGTKSNDTKQSLVNCVTNDRNKMTTDKTGIIYYSMNV